MGGYKCASVGCYSYQSIETDTLFNKLQATINQFAQGLAFTPIDVDGIIGRGTTEVTLLVLDFLAEADPGPIGASAKSLSSGINSTEQLAANAQAVVDTLTLATRQSKVASQTTPIAALPPAVAEPSAATKATTMANAPLKTSSPAVQQRLDAISKAKPALAASLLDRVPPWSMYAGGAALLIGTLAAVGIAVSKKKKSGGSASALAPAAAAVAGRMMGRWAGY
jgi:hypothetical protein